MAKIQPSALLSDINGKCGDQIFSRNHAGLYVKGMFTPPNPQTPAQVAEREGFRVVSAAWKTLTDEQRKLWTIAANQVIKTDCFGNRKTPTGFHYYMSCNFNLFLIGSSPLLVPEFNQYVYDMSHFTLSLTLSPVFNFDMLFNPFADCYDTRTLIFATPAVSQGISYVRSLYRLIGFIDEFGYDVFPLTDLYTSVFGTPSAGLKIFIKIKGVNLLSGIVGNPIIKSVFTS